MPTYDYRCRKCGHLFEQFHSIKDDAPRRCPRCRSRADRVPSGGAGLLFKGSGFYITDYRSKSYRESAKQEKSGGTGGTGGTAPPSEKPHKKKPPGGSGPPKSGASD